MTNILHKPEYRVRSVYRASTFLPGPLLVQVFDVKRGESSMRYVGKVTGSFDSLTIETKMMVWAINLDSKAARLPDFWEMA